ncbi:Ligand-binding domain of nuclear hormone receptor [Dictyocaulus viviparus]|uniref:Ligand-binding domain of nuclear hormone receptor n=1 Tax=Dictyocaulus viviparus TaxID=29172 RepID=A0A0D8X746_DICVI|nr:Ligand-binding domain of nuclear hormone receptor [Dictyocaulus viviparus]
MADMEEAVNNNDRVDLHETVNYSPTFTYRDLLLVLVNALLHNDTSNDNFKPIAYCPEQIALLRASYILLTLLELGRRSNTAASHHWFESYSSTTPNILIFLTSNTSETLLKWTERHLKPLQLSLEELVLLKTLTECLNYDEFMIASYAGGLSTDDVSAVEALRDCVHSALYCYCVSKNEQTKAAARLSKILLTLPQLCSNQCHEQQLIAARGPTSFTWKCGYIRTKKLISESSGSTGDG